MGFERADNNTEHTTAESPENARGMFLEVAAKHPRLRKLALVLGTLSALGSSQASAETKSETEQAETPQVVSTYESHESTMEAALEAIDDPDIQAEMRKLHTELMEAPELPDSFDQHTYYSVNVSESVHDEDNVDRTSFFDTTQGELPDQGENLLYGSYNKMRYRESYDGEYSDGEEGGILWSGYAEHDVIAPADVTLERGETTRMYGEGATKAEAVEAALERALEFVQGRTISVDRKLDTKSQSGETPAWEEHFFERSDSQVLGYIKEYRVLSGDVLPDADFGDVAVHKVEIEVTIGVPEEDAPTETQ